jgi:hypothetical protein
MHPIDGAAGDMREPPSCWFPPSIGSVRSHVPSLWRFGIRRRV